MRFVLGETTEKELLNYFQTSTRLDRASDLVRYGYVTEDAPNLFSVRSQKHMAKFYTVDLRRPSCDCPDWTFRGADTGIPCKHIQAALLVRGLKPVPE